MRVSCYDMMYVKEVTILWHSWHHGDMNAGQWGSREGGTFVVRYSAQQLAWCECTLRAIFFYSLLDQPHKSLPPPSY